MQLCLEESWESFENEVNGKGIILFGASSCAGIFISKLKGNYKIKYLVDNNKEKIEKKWDTGSGCYDVFSPEKLKETTKEEILLITSTYYSEIVEQLDELKFQGRVYSFLHLRNKVEQNFDPNNFRSNIEKLKELMYDTKSKQIIEKIFQKKVDNILDYSDIEEDAQYFVKDIIQSDNNAVFIDGGSYDGETVKKFIEFQNDSFKKVYSFEMDSNNFSKIDNNQFDSRVSFLNYGLWNQRETVSFISQNRGSEIDRVGNSVAQCVALDDIIKEQVTFIKMDIEGAEQKAILGARRIIMEDKPQLSICLYHKFSDLWEIAFMLVDMVPEYKFFIRHHSSTYEETVLYAAL